MTHWLEADNFFLRDPVRLENLTFWNFERSGFFAGTVIWQIFTDDGSGSPGTLLFTGTSRNVSHIPTGYFAFSGFAEFLTSFDIGPISLPRGSYWLGLHNGDWLNGQTGDIQTWNFYWEATPNTNGAASENKIAPFDGSWRSNAFPQLPPDLAFQLSGASAPSLPGLKLNGSNAEVSFASNIATTYRVEFKNTLSNPSWSALPGADRLAGTGDIIGVTDSTIEGQSQRFYRVTVLYEGPGAPVISAFGYVDHGPQISFTTSAGYFYRVEYKNDLSDLSWSPVSGAESIVGSGDIMQFGDPDPNLASYPRRFYRVTLQ
jgi:hypothetical protein